MATRGTFARQMKNWNFVKMIDPEIAMIEFRGKRLATQSQAKQGLMLSLAIAYKNSPNHNPPFVAS